MQTSRAITSRAVTSRAGSISSPRSKFTSILWLDIYSLPSKLLVTFNIYITTGMCLEKQISQVIWDEGNIFFELRTEVADRPSKLSEPRAIVHYYYCVGVLVC
jgi:hypothetical protein